MHENFVTDFWAWQFPVNLKVDIKIYFMKETKQACQNFG